MVQFIYRVIRFVNDSRHLQVTPNIHSFKTRNINCPLHESLPNHTTKYFCNSSFLPNYDRVLGALIFNGLYPLIVSAGRIRTRFNRK